MTTTRKIPLEDFFRKPERTSVRLSPDGRWLAWLAPWERRLNVHVAPTSDPDAAMRVTEAAERDIAGFLWASSERIVFVKDQGGDEIWHLYAVGRDGANRRDLTPYEGAKCTIVDDLEDVPGEILYQRNDRDPQLFDVYHLNVETGEERLVAENPGNISEWVTDHRGRLRVAVTTDGVNTTLLHRATEDEEWAEVATWDFKENASPLLFDFDDELLYVTSNVDRDKRVIRTLDPRTAEEGPVMFEHPEVDLSGLLVSKARKVVTGVGFHADRPGYRFVDDLRRRIQEFLDAELPGRQNTLGSHSRDETRYIVYSGGDRTLGSYHRLDVRGDELLLTPLFEVGPWLKEEELCAMQPVRYTARDGLEIPAYLTLPLGREPKNLPLVIHPHGGPWARDAWGFNPEVQFLANRGYAVLQMNFRGSIGYGREFMEASFKQWGLAMQDDISDGVKWAVDSGLADPKRVAIYGGSYGGYATLAGMTFTPELYACGIDYVGVSNLFTWIEAFPPDWKLFLEMVQEMVGHPERDKEQWKATSPVFHVDRITSPLLVAQGANDPRVKQEESDQIVAALRERGVPVEYLVKEDEGHGFQNEENRFEFYRAMERFLAEHL